jgi:hypothetical protein
MNPRITIPGLLALVVSAGPAASAQRAPVGGYVFGDWGIARPAVKSPTSVATATDGADREQATTTFKWSTAPLFNVGGGAIFGGRLTVGAAFERSRDEQPADVLLSLSHPSFHPTLTATKATDSLERVENAFHVEFGYRFPSRGPLAIRVFAGPTRFMLRQDMVSDVSYDETFNTSTRTFLASIDTLETDSVKASGWGYNVGVDAGFYPTPHLGFGGLVRYTRGVVDLENPLQTLIDDRTVADPVDVGGLRVSGGIRVRF